MFVLSLGGTYEYAVRMVSGGMIYTRVVMIDLGIQIIFKILPQQFERL
jgi:hypothetical protein